MAFVTQNLLIIIILKIKMTTTPKFLNSIPWHLVATRFLPNHQSTKENSYSWSIFHQKRNGNLNTAKLFHESLARLKHLFIHFSKNLTWRRQEIQHENHKYNSSFFFHYDLVISWTKHKKNTEEFGQHRGNKMILAYTSKFIIYVQFALGKTQNLTLSFDLICDLSPNPKS